MRPLLATPTMIDEASGIFAALGDPSRLRILQVLLEAEAPLNQGIVAARAHLTQANASKHLSCLVRTGLLTRSQEGNTVYYLPVQPMVSDLCALVGAHVSHRVAATLQALN